MRIRRPLGYQRRIGLVPTVAVNGRTQAEVAGRLGVEEPAIWFQVACGISKMIVRVVVGSNTRWNGVC